MEGAIFCGLELTKKTHNYYNACDVWNFFGMEKISHGALTNQNKYVACMGGRSYDNKNRNWMPHATFPITAKKWRKLFIPTAKFAEFLSSWIMAAAVLRVFVRTNTCLMSTYETAIALKEE